jgi:hypothetical protein
VNNDTKNIFKAYSELISEQSIAPEIQPIGAKDAVKAAVLGPYGTISLMRKIWQNWNGEFKNPSSNVEWPEQDQILNAFANPFFVGRSESQRVSDLKEFLRSINKNDVDRAVAIAGKYGLKPEFKGKFD